MPPLFERLIDLVATFGLLAIAYSLRLDQPALAGAVVSSSVQFWLSKNARTHINEGREIGAQRSA
jgi:hypothetical protein